ncbi:MAG: M20 family metallopeptidase [Bacillota bacterium]
MSALGLKDAIERNVDSLADQLCAVSDRMYANPELGHAEYRAAQWLTELLERAGFVVERGLAGMETAFRATLRGKGGGPCIAILAEYDALPELGHGCGHNIIGSAAVGAGLALAPLIKEVPGTLVILGSPAEEGAVDNAGGKVIMVEHGVFDGIDAAIMVHPSSRNMVMTSSNARQALEITFHGRTAHAAGAPHLGINALEALITMWNAINSLRQHVKDEVRIHGIITKGGVSPNIVPDLAQARMYVRAASRQYLDEVVEKVKNCAWGAALATGATVEFRNTANTYANMVTNRVIADAFKANLLALGAQVDDAERSGAGSTDMGNVSHVVPAAHPYIRICQPEVIGHSREFADATVSEEGHRGLILGAKGLAMTAFDLLTSPELLAEAKAEFSRVRPS